MSKTAHSVSENEQRRLCFGLAGFYEYVYSGKGGLRVTPDLRSYVYTYRSCLEALTLTDLGNDWWK